jgi:hypothetical protein
VDRCVYYIGVCVGVGVWDVGGWPGVGDGGRGRSIELVCGGWEAWVVGGWVGVQATAVWLVDGAWAVRGCVKG